jgi:hypothetical protein
MTTFLRRCFLGALALTMVACAAQSGGGTLRTGMTTDQAIAAMGKPDLTDAVPDPNHSGATVLRYTWLTPGEAAVFGSNDRVASIQNIGQNPSTVKEAEDAQTQQSNAAFDPIETPLDYAFYPFRLAAIYTFAGLNCIVGTNACHMPHAPPVTRG